MNDKADVAEADRALKQKHRAMWASGDYPVLASELVLDLGAILLDACGIKPKQCALDVAADAGNAAIPAAMMGAGCGEAHGDAAWQMEWEYLLLTAKKGR